MKAKKNVSILLITFLLITSILAGCSTNNTDNNVNNSKDNVTNENNSNKDDNNNDETAESTEITFWTLTTRQEAVDPIVEKFEELNQEIDLTVAYYDTDGIKDACKVAASSNTLPTIWFNWGGSLGGFYVDNGLTYDLTDYALANDWENTFNAGALNLCTLDGKLSGYPTSYNVLGVYYRKDIFDKYSLEVPETFEDFEEVCATLKENDIIPISTAGLYGWHVMRFVELLVEHYAGQELHDKLNTFKEPWAKNEAVIQALSKYQEFCEKDYFPIGFITADPNDTNMAVFSGQAAMDIQGQWYDGTIVQNEQDMDLYGVFSLPTTGTNRMSAFAEMTQFNANVTELELEASMAFMDYYYNEENSSEYSQYYNLPLPKIGAAMPQGQPNVEAMMNMSNETGTFTITDQAFPTEIADGLFNVQESIANGIMTPEEGAQEIQDSIDNYLNK